MGETPEWEYGQEYTQARAGEVLDVCDRLGLNSEFRPILAQYITDLHLITNRKNDPINVLELRTLSHDGGREWARTLALDEADLKFRVDTLAAVLGLSTAQVEPEEALESNVLPLFKRLTLVDAEDVADYLDKVTHPADADPIDPQTQAKAVQNSKALTLAAIDWAFYEQVTDIIGGAHLMRNGFGKYIGDLNDQNPLYYGAQFSPSSIYLAANGISPDKLTVEEDRDMLRRGFGLMQLHDSLLKHGLVSHAKRAEWAIQTIRGLYSQYEDAYRVQQIAEHLQALVPVKDVLQGYQKLSELIDPLIDPDSED